MINIPTRIHLYANEATDILTEIATYPGILQKQLIKMHPGKEDKVQNLLSFFQRQNRIVQDECNSLYKAGCIDKRNQDAIIRSIWVLLDFISDVEYHTASMYPVMIVFFIKGEEYQIIHAPEGSAGIIGAVLREQSDYSARRILLVDSPSQINHLRYSGVTAYCTVSTNGEIQYYKEKQQ